MTDLDVFLAHAGITYRQLDWWVRKGYLNPRHDGGSGNPRDFDTTETLIATRMARLVNRGFKPHAAARIARASVENDTTHVTLGAGLSLLIHDDEEVAAA